MILKGIPLAFAAIVGLILAGCSTAPNSTAAWADWARRQGGITDGPELSRARAGCAKLCAGNIDRPVVVKVLNTPGLVAYSWPDGTIFVAAGLVNALNDDELMAAEAHEMGHLLADGHVGSVYALHGQPGDDNVECRADNLGCQLLIQNGVKPAAMISMLKKVALDHGGSNEGGIAMRIRMLQQRYASASH